MKALATLLLFTLLINVKSFAGGNSLFPPSSVPDVIEARVRITEESQKPAPTQDPASQKMQNTTTPANTNVPCENPITRYKMMTHTSGASC